MKILHRDQTTASVHGMIARIGVLPNAGQTVAYRVLIAGYESAVTVTADSLVRMRDDIDALVLAQPGDHVSMTVTRHFGRIHVDDFVNETFEQTLKVSA